MMMPVDEGKVFQRKNDKTCLQLIGSLEKTIIKTTLNLLSNSWYNEEDRSTYPQKSDIKLDIIYATTNIEQ